VHVLVSGGAGFIGSHLVARLLERGDEVSVVDLRPCAIDGIRMVLGDIREQAVVEDAVAQGVEAVVHLAAITSVLQSMKDPMGVFLTNVVGTELLLERCRERGVGRFVLASSNAVVGDVGRRKIDETIAPRPLTAYGATKAAGEMLLSAYAASYAMTTVALRFTNIYGAGMQAKDSVVARMMRAALQGGGIDIYGDGEQLRDYLYVSDAVAAIELALGLEHADVLTIGFGASVSMNELYRLACEVTGVAIGARHVPAKPGEMPAVVVDISKAKAAGFMPRYGLREGLAATWEDFSGSS
jgi:UDP-glucose 4-epimerase